MPMFKKVFAGIVLSAALTGGALAMGATAASASSFNGPFTNNTNCWNNLNNCWANQNCWWNNNCFKSSRNDSSTFAIATKDVAIGFSDETCRDDWFCNNFAFSNNNWWNYNDNNFFNNDCLF